MKENQFFSKILIFIILQVHFDNISIFTYVAILFHRKYFSIKKHYRLKFILFNQSTQDSCMLGCVESHIPRISLFHPLQKISCFSYECIKKKWNCTISLHQICTLHALHILIVMINFTRQLIFLKG